MPAQTVDATAGIVANVDNVPSIGLVVPEKKRAYSRPYIRRLALLLTWIWPVLLPVAPLIGLLLLVPPAYENFHFAHDGVEAFGWYVDVEQQNEYIHFAYQAGDKTFGGQESWNDQNSDIYYRHNGDKLPITYLGHRPWIYRTGWASQNRWQNSKTSVGACAVIFLGTLLASIALMARRRSRIRIGTGN